jgi:hypothetical protein
MNTNLGNLIFIFVIICLLLMGVVFSKKLHSGIVCTEYEQVITLKIKPNVPVVVTGTVCLEGGKWRFSN